MNVNCGARFLGDIFRDFCFREIMCVCGGDLKYAKNKGCY